MDTSFPSLLRRTGALLSAALLGSRTRSAPPTSRPGPARPARTAGADSAGPQRADAVRPVPAAEALAGASYEPSPDGDADPGEVVWAWIPYEDDVSQGKDRPVVVLGRAPGGVYVAQMTSKDHDRDAAQEARWGRFWMDVGTGAWDPRRRPSEVRLDRVLWVPDGTVRREGATLPAATFRAVLDALGRVAALQDS